MAGYELPGFLVKQLARAANKSMSGGELLGVAHFSVVLTRAASCKRAVPEIPARAKGSAA